MTKSFFYSLCFLGVFLGLKAQNRIVLIEQFSNSSCPPCAAVSPSVYAYANANPTKVLVVAYHTLFPYNNDSMYFENPVEASQRVSYYSVNAVPYSVLDGNVYNGSTGPFVSNISNLVSTRLNADPRFKIEAQNLSLSGKQLSGSVKFTSVDALNSSDNLVAHVVVIEKRVLKSSYAASPGANSETEYGYVMRKMIPDANGMILTNTSLNNSEDLNISWTIEHIKNTAELRLVAFAQNIDTKEIYQAGIFEVSDSPTSLSEEKPDSISISIFPNPIRNKLSIILPSEEFLYSAKIISMTGAIQYEETINGNTSKISLELNLKGGVYFIKLSGNTRSSLHKIVVCD